MPVWLAAGFPALYVAQDQLGLGAGWMQPDDIKMPARPAPQSSKTRGLREKYEQKTLRQKYAADDTNVPEYAVRRVNEYVPSHCCCWSGCIHMSEVVVCTL